MTVTTACSPDTITQRALGVPSSPLWRLAVFDGELDLATAPRLAALLIATATAPDNGAGVVADLTHVEFCDSTGLTALVAARNHLRTKGRDLVFRNPPPTVRAMVDLFYGDDDLIEHADDRKPCCLTC